MDRGAVVAGRLAAEGHPHPIPADGVGRVGDAPVAEIAAWAESQLPRLIDDVYSTVCQRIDLYRDETIVPRDDLHRSITVNLGYLVRALSDARAVDDLTGPIETGRRRALQGAPLPEVLRVYRIGAAMLWEVLVEHARGSTQRGYLDALVDTASVLWQLTDEHAIALTEAYRLATAELLGAQQRRRSALVEALFTSQPVLDAGPWEAGKLLGLPLDTKLTVVAAETSALAEESLVGIERRLAELGLVSAWRLTPTLQAGVVAMRDEQRDSVLALLRDAATARTGVSPAYRSLAETPRALHLAKAALAGIPPGRAEVRVFSPSPLAALIAYDPDEGRRLATEVLGAVLDLPTEDRNALLDTLQAFLDNGGSSDRAAQVLSCHPNTIRYRLRRLRELTGRSLTDPQGIAELVTAAQAVRLNPEGRAPVHGPSDIAAQPTAAGLRGLQ